MSGILTVALFGAAIAQLSAADLATVPMLVEGNRPFVQLSFRKPDGTDRRARFWVDTGGGGFLLVQKLAADLGLKPEGEPSEEGGAKFWPTRPPRSWLGGFELNLSGCRAVIAEPGAFAGVPVEGLLPGHVLRNHDVVLDYPRRTFTIAKPGRLKPEGVRLPAPVSVESGFPRIELEIDGEKLGFLLDTGAAFTMVSKSRFDGWMQKHPDWLRRQGAFGHANMTPSQDAQNWIGRLEDVRLGDIFLGPLEIVTRQPGIFEEWMSKEMTAPIVGSVAGNVLKQFRVELLYSRSAVYLKGRPEAQTMEFSGMPWTVGREKGVWLIVAAPEASGVKLRDEIVSINGKIVRDFSLAEIQQALLGTPGDKKEVVLQRGGEPIKLKAVVSRVL